MLGILICRRIWKRNLLSNTRRFYDISIINPYLKRMITVGFLIVIAPFSKYYIFVDKMGDNRSQALNTWFKEFCYNILIQPFQCVSYIILASSAMKVLDDEASLSAMLVAIMMILFIYESERIIRHIFHFEAKTMAETVSQAALVGTAFKMATKGAGKVKEITPEDNEKQEKKNAEEIAKIKKNTKNKENLEYSNPKNYETNMGQVQSKMITEQAYSEAENAARENFINNLVMKQMNINSLDNLDENQKQQAMNISRTIEEREGENITEHAKNFIALRTNEIVNGKEPTTEEEKKILEAITDLRTAYQDNGMNENHANTQILQTLGIKERENIKKQRIWEQLLMKKLMKQKI